MVKRLAVVLAAALIGVACGSGDDAGTAADGTAGADAASPADDGSGDRGTVDPEAGAEWCDAAREVDDRLDALEAPDFDLTDPAQVEQVFTEAMAALRDVQPSAPPEIAADLATTIEGFERFDDALAAVDYDFLSADLSVLEALDEEMSTAGDRIEAYHVAICGFEPGGAGDDVTSSGEGSSDGGSFDPSAGPIRDQLVDELAAAGFTVEEATCIVETIDFGDLTALDDPDGLAAVFDACEIGPARLAEIGG